MTTLGTTAPARSRAAQDEAAAILRTVPATSPGVERLLGEWAKKIEVAAATGDEVLAGQVALQAVQIICRAMGAHEYTVRLGGTGSNVGATYYAGRVITSTTAPLRDERLTLVQRLAVMVGIAMHEAGHARLTSEHAAIVRRSLGRAEWDEREHLPRLGNIASDISLEAETQRDMPGYAGIFAITAWWVATRRGDVNHIARAPRTQAEALNVGISATRYDPLTTWASDDAALQAERVWWQAWGAKCVGLKPRTHLQHLRIAAEHIAVLPRWAADENEQIEDEPATDEDEQEQEQDEQEQDEDEQDDLPQPQPETDEDEPVTEPATDEEQDEDEDEDEDQDEGVPGGERGEVGGDEERDETPAPARNGLNDPLPQHAGDGLDSEEKALDAAVNAAAGASRVAPRVYEVRHTDATAPVTHEQERAARIAAREAAVAAARASEWTTGYGEQHETDPDTGVTTTTKPVTVVGLDWGSANAVAAPAESKAAMRRAFADQRTQPDQRPVVGRRGNRISSKHIARVASGRTDIFVQRDLPGPDRLDLHLLVDCSSSMAGDTIANALQISASLVEVIASRGEGRSRVWGFSTGTVIDAYDSRRGEPLARLGGLNASGGTDEATALSAVASIVAEEKGATDRSIIVVLADGAPGENEGRWLPAVVEQARKGATVISVALAGGMTAAQIRGYGAEYVVTWKGDWGLLAREMAGAIGRAAALR